MNRPTEETTISLCEGGTSREVKVEIDTYELRRKFDTRACIARAVDTPERFIVTFKQGSPRILCHCDGTGRAVRSCLADILSIEKAESEDIEGGPLRSPSLSNPGCRDFILTSKICALDGIEQITKDLVGS